MRKIALFAALAAASCAAIGTASPVVIARQADPHREDVRIRRLAPDSAPAGYRRSRNKPHARKLKPNRNHISRRTRRRHRRAGK